MKKILMGSTACIGLGLIAGPAVADEPISLGLGGYFHGYGVFGEDDGVLGANRRNYKISRESEVHFKG